MPPFFSSWLASLVRPPAAGLDLSDQSVKYMKLGVRRGQKWTIEAFGSAILPEGLIVKGEIRQEEALVDTLRQWLAGEPASVRASPMVASLPEEKSFLRLIQIPAVPSEETAGAVRWEIEGNIPLPADEVYYDYEVIEPLEDHLDHRDVVITAFPKTVIDSYLGVFRAAGIQISALELESQAIIRATIPALREKATRVIAEMGRLRTNFIVFAGAEIFFTRTVEMGGKMLEQNIMHALGVDQASAADLKKTVGLNKRARNGEVFSALVPSISVLADELTQTVDYYQTHAEHVHGAPPVVSEILVTGGDANLMGLDTYFSSVLKIPARRADPFVTLADQFSESVPPYTKNESLAFTTAMGLALRGLR